MKDPLPSARDRRTGSLSRSHIWAGLAALAITIFAFSVRVYAVGWGLPYVDHPDEPGVVKIVLHMLETHDLNPHFFGYPSLYYYLLLGVFSQHFAWGQAHGLYPSLSKMTITADFFTTIPGFFIWGRMLTVVLGTATVLAVYHLGKRSWTPAAGLFAAMFIATSPFHMRQSQYVTTDIPSAWFVVIAFAAAVAIAQCGRWRSYIAAGILTGFAAGTKYNAGVVLLPVMMAHAIYWRRNALARSPRLLLAIALAALTFVITTPYALLAFDEFRQGIIDQIHVYREGAHGDLIGAWNIQGYLSFFWRDGIRPAACGAGLIGLFVLLRRQREFALLWLSFAVPYLLLLLSLPTHFMRNLLPLLVLCALPVGIGATAVASELARRSPRLAWATRGIVVLVLIWFPARDTILFTHFESLPDTRLLATDLIHTLPRGQRIAVELNPVQWSGDPLIEPVKQLTVHTVAWYRANDFRYLVANDRMRTKEDQAAYAALRAAGTLVRLFPGDQSGQPGPEIEVLDLGQHPNDLDIVRRPAEFEPGLHLLGFEMEPGPLRPAITPLDGADEPTLQTGDALQINLTWRSDTQLAHDYILFVHVLDPEGRAVAQRDAPLRAGDYPTSQWRPGEVVVDRADLPLPALPPGKYRVELGIYRQETGERLPLATPEPGSDGTSLLLTTIAIRT